MKKISTYKIHIIIPCIFLFCLYSCSSTKYVGKNQYLLNKVKINIEGDKISKGDILANVRQKPNLKVLGIFRFKLGIYNLSGKNTDKWYNRWFRTIGEEPVVYEDFLKYRSLEQIKLYLKNVGYYNAEVSDTVIYTSKNKLKVVYNIKSGVPYKIDKMKYSFNDTLAYYKGYTDVKEIILNDSINNLVKEKSKMDVSQLEKELSRIVKKIRNKGYYNFSDKCLHYYADSTLGNKNVDIFLNLKDDKASNKKSYLRYKYRDVFISMNYDPHILVDSVLRSKMKYDTVSIGNNHFIFEGKPYINNKIILDAIHLEAGEYYSIRDVDITYQRLQGLKQFKFINVKFVEEEVAETDTVGYIDCHIQLKPLDPQKYSIFVEGTNSGGNIGMAGNLSYQHRNVFKRAEILTVTLSGSLEKERVKIGTRELFTTKEYGIKTKLVSPQFIVPFFKLTEFRRKYLPQTALGLSFDGQETYYFNRKTIGASYGYMWRLGRNWRYNLNLINLDFVQMNNVNQDFINDLKNEYVKNSYTDHMVMSSNFSFVYSGGGRKADISNKYLKFNIESAGNFANAFKNILGSKNILEDEIGEIQDEYYSYWGIRYAQYIKSDVEYRYNYLVNKENSLVSRFFLGIAYPYGNFKVLPYEKMYYCGGANGIRAWQVRTLGPGSKVQTGENNFPNLVSDMKIEANLEYRFNIIGRTEGALFIDAGNIWALNEKETDEAAKFKLSKFYREFAVGTGLGVRFDFKFFILRFDAGIKVVDPSQPKGKRFVFMKDGYKNINDMTLNIGIGYPF